MSDLVKRLRVGVPHREYGKLLNALCDEAADEIERLQAELARATHWNHSVRVCAEHTADVVTDEPCVICEIERLQKELAAQIQMFKLAVDGAFKVRDERDALLDTMDKVSNKRDE